MTAGSQRPYIRSVTNCTVELTARKDEADIAEKTTNVQTIDQLVEANPLERLIKIKNNEDFLERFEKLIQDYEESNEKIERRTIYRLEINPKKIDKVKEERTKMSNEDKFKYMLTQEFDYKRETKENPLLDISLKTHVKIRPYQEKALSKMFVEGRYN